MEIRKMRPEDSSRAYALICESLDSYFVPSIVDYFMMQWPGGQIVATDFTGDIIGYKEISNPNNVIYGEIYLVAFKIDGDEYLAVKYANRSEKEGYVKLVSYNTHHEPMDIALTAITAMAIVKFSIRRHMMM